MNQPVEGTNQPQEQGILVIYLTDSDSSDKEPDSDDEPAEREAHPGPVVGPLEDTCFPHCNRQDFWENVERPSRLFEDPGPLPEPPVKLPRRKPSIPGESPLSNDVYAALESFDPYWMEQKYNPKRRCYSETCNSAQSTTAEE
jgi:hypothetical protein